MKATALGRVDFVLFYRRSCEKRSWIVIYGNHVYMMLTWDKVFKFLYPAPRYFLQNYKIREHFDTCSYYRAENVESIPDDFVLFQCHPQVVLEIKRLNN